MGVEIEHNVEASRYELRVDGELASTASYSTQADRIVFPHTETLPRFRGRGLAEQVVRRALDDARAERRVVVPQCWFVAQFIDEHPEYADLLAAT